MDDNGNSLPRAIPNNPARQWLRLAPTFGAAWLFLLLQPIPHVIALRYLDLIWMIVAVVLLYRRRSPVLDPRSPLLQAVVLVLGTMILSVLCHPHDAASGFDALRKEVLPPMLALLILLAAGPGERAAWLAPIVAILLGLTLRTALVASEWSVIEMPLRLDSIWAKGYAVDAVMYTPLAVAAIAALPRRTWIRFALFMLLLLHVAILLKYQTRTAVVACYCALAVATLLLGRWRLLALLLVASGGLLLASMHQDAGMQQRYQSIFNAESYEGPGGGAGRYPIWVGTWEIARQHPVVGYGLGWKKLATVAKDEGFITRWRAAPDAMHRQAAVYFDHPGGMVNPHNLMLQILFEAGVAGLLAYAVLVLAFARTCFRLWQHRKILPEAGFIGVCGLSFLAAWIILNMSNGLWPFAGPFPGLLALAELGRRSLLPATPTPA